MDPALLWLVLAGIGAGLCGSIAGLASLASYPAMLAAGLTPIEANVTNTVALVGLTIGSGFGSRRELRGQGRRLVGLLVPGIAGGLLGAALLLLAPAEAFELVVPWLVALGAVLILARDRIRRWVTRHASDDADGGGGGASAPHARHPVLWMVVLVLVGVYGGYFGAGVGIIALAVLGVGFHEPLPVVNALKNAMTGIASGVAAVVYAVVAPVDWPIAVAVGIGAVLGGLAGPAVVRVLPEAPLRYAVAAGGFYLALSLV